MWNARRPHPRHRDGVRRLASTEVAYRTASGGVVIATVPAGNGPLRAIRSTVARRSG